MLRPCDHFCRGPQDEVFAAEFAESQYQILIYLKATASQFCIPSPSNMMPLEQPESCRCGEPLRPPNNQQTQPHITPGYCQACCHWRTVDQRDVRHCQKESPFLETLIPLNEFLKNTQNYLPEDSSNPAMEIMTNILLPPKEFSSQCRQEIGSVLDPPMETSF